MSLRNISRLRNNILQRRCELVISENNMAKICVGSNKVCCGSKQDGSAKYNYNLYGLFSSCATPSDSNPSNPSAPTMYDCRKYGHLLPTNKIVPDFETLPMIPSGVFRCTVGEQLGLGAGKSCYYKCPEYFSYHHMSFYDFHLKLRPCRKSCPKTKRKP